MAIMSSVVPNLTTSNEPAERTFLAPRIRQAKLSPTAAISEKFVRCVARVGQ